ncbi:hypothetical protein ACFPRL_13240 [Pseudoclavibacter helvolus]
MHRRAPVQRLTAPRTRRGARCPQSQNSRDRTTTTSTRTDASSRWAEEHPVSETARTTSGLLRPALAAAGSATAPRRCSRPPRPSSSRLACSSAGAWPSAGSVKTGRSRHPPTVRSR